MPFRSSVDWAMVVRTQYRQSISTRQVLAFAMLAEALLALWLACPSSRPAPPTFISPRRGITSRTRCCGWRASTATDVVYDLGSGDGRIPIIAAQKYGARGVGIEIDPRLVELSWRTANEAQVAHRVSFIVGDLFETDLSQATVVTAYLSPQIMKILEPKFRALKPGTRIVSHQFPMKGWPPDRRIKVDEAELLLWTVPEP